MISSLKIEGFRNLSSRQLEFGSGINLFCGPNGSGKTNILEAIGMYALAKSCRGAKESEMVGFGREMTEIEAEVSGLKKKSKLP